MEKEIKLERGLVLKKYPDGEYLVCDKNLDIFLHGQELKLKTTETYGWLGLRNNGVETSSIWICRQTTIKRIKKLMEE